MTAGISSIALKSFAFSVESRIYVSMRRL
jgi:hypothetical protein